MGRRHAGAMGEQPLSTRTRPRSYLRESMDWLYCVLDVPSQSIAESPVTGLAEAASRRSNSSAVILGCKTHMQSEDGRNKERSREYCINDVLVNRTLFVEYVIS